MSPDDDAGIYSDSSSNDMIVVGIPADEVDIRQRTGKLAGDPLQIRAPRKDCLSPWPQLPRKRIESKA